MEHKLVMRFTTEEEGKYFTLSIERIKTDEEGEAAINKDDVNALMDTIIQKNIFKSKNGKVVGKKDAKIVSTGSRVIKLQ